MTDTPQVGQSEYDLFVSYSQADRGWVEGYLLDALSAAGVRVISELNFSLGAPRLDEFERAIKQSKRTLLVLSPAYVAESAAQFAAIMSLQYGLDSGTWPVIPLLLHPVDLPLRLALLTPLDMTEVESWPAALERLFKDLHANAPTSASRPPCPYPGMRAFQEQESDKFYGREAEVEQLVQRLRAHPFAAVIGASGSGKSSLVFAGLLPALRRSSLFGAGGWLVSAMRPGSQPMTELTTALGGAAIEQFDPATLLTTENGAGRLLLVVDQFEELFTQGAGQKEAFFAALRRLIALRSCYVVITVRSDFFTELLTSTLWPIIDARRLEIAPLGVAGLREAIVAPAEDVGVFIESALVERLVAGSAGQPGLLPFVQELMVRLWEKLERRFLPLRAYEALVLPLAGYSGSERESIIAALALLADEIVHRLKPPEQTIARRIFLRLVQFGEGRDDTRRQQPKSALSAAGDDAAQFESTLNSLAENRLVVLSGDEKGEVRVDLAHEAMLTGWPLLRNWVKEGKEAEGTRRRYEDRAAEWVRLGRGKSGLLSAPDFVEFQKWVDSPVTRDGGLSNTLFVWLDACQRELRTQHIRGLFLRGLAIGLALFIIIAVLIAWATLNPIDTGWNVASALPLSAADMRVRLTPGDPDRVYLFAPGQAEFFDSEDGGYSWQKIVPGEVDIVDIAVGQDELCVLFSKSAVCNRIGQSEWASLSLPTVDSNIAATALAIDPQNKERLAVGYSSGRIDLSQSDGREWKSIAASNETFAVDRLGFSGERLIALSNDAAHGALIIDLGGKDSTQLIPEPAWPAPAHDLSIPSGLGRFLIATSAGDIIDADVENTAWNLFFDPPPVVSASLSVWEDDIYVIDKEQIYCKRVWTWRQLNWWRAYLGLHRPCMNRL